MKEKGVLMAFRNEQGALGDMARRAFFEVMNPKMPGQPLPAAASATGAGNVVPP
jgi:hypothetical protein